MQRIFFTLWWAALFSSGIIAFARFLHPATYSPFTLSTVLFIAFTSLTVAINNTRYE